MKGIRDHTKAKIMKKRKSPTRKLKDVASADPKPLLKENSVKDAGEKMRVLRAERYPVAAGGKLVGTIEEKFPDRKVAGFGHDPATTLVGDNMTQTKIYWPLR